MDWKPIESAPRDGSQVIFLGRYGKAVVAYWGDLNVADSEFGTVEHEPRWCWLSEHDCKRDRVFIRMEWLDPIGWMALPPPPPQD
jgi:hypothetical protein